MSAYLIPGLVIGTVYGLAAAGLALTYSTTGVLNLANGAISFVIAEVFFNLTRTQGWPPALSGVVAVGIVAPAVGLLLWATVFRRLEEAPFTVTLVSTVGLAVALPALVRMALPHDVVFAAPGLIENGKDTFELFGMQVNGDQLVAILGGLVAIVALVVVLNATRLGLVMRSVVDSKRVATLVGVRTNLTSAVAWVLGSCIAGLAGVLLAPVLALDARIFTELTVTSVSVALIGRFRRVGVAYLGGIALGLVSALVIRYAPPGGLISGAVRPALPFLLLVVLLAFGGRALDVHRRDGKPVWRVPRPRPGSPTTKLLGRVVPVAVLCVVPLLLSGYWSGIWALAFAYGVVFLSFSIAVGEGGLVPLCSAALAGIGGFAAADLANDHGTPILVAIALGGLLAAAFGFVLATVGLRLGRLGFGLLTLAFALFADRFLFRVDWLVPQLGVTFGPLEVLGYEIDTERGLAYAFMAIFALAAGLVWWLRRSVLGMYWAALRGDVDVAECTGVRTDWLRIATFSLSAFLAGVGGCLIGIYQQHLAHDNVATVVGLVWVAVAVTVGARGVLAPLVAGLAYAFLPAFLASTGGRLAELPVVLFGLGAVSLAQDPRGVVASAIDTFWAAVDRYRRKAPPGAPPPRGAAVVAASTGSVGA